MISTETIDAIRNMHDVWGEVDRIRESVSASPFKPANSFTINEYCERYSISRSTARSQMDGLIRSGKVRRGYAMVPDSTGRIVRMTVYEVQG